MRVILVLAAASCLLLADDTPRGVPARPSATDYAAQAKWQHATFAASLVPQKQAEHLFAFDISRSFLVFEVACYADSAAETKVRSDGFVVKVNASGDAVHNSDPATVSSAVERQNLPPIPSEIGPHVETAATVGMAHGTDPYTGRPVNGVYTAGEVTVEQGGPDRTGPPRDPKPGGTPEDRRILEAQLKARSIPDGPVHQSVAGYVFFRRSDVKTQPNGTYALEYLAEDEGSGTPHAILLAVPKKAH